MSGRRAIAWLAVAGALVLSGCEPAVAEEVAKPPVCKSITDCIAHYLTSTGIQGLALGAVLGLCGLLVQLGLRAEWPTGRLNEGSPKVLDPGRLVIAVLMAIAAGIIACQFFSLAKESETIRNALAIAAFGYLAADLGPDQIKKLWEKIKGFFKSLANFPKWIRGS